MAAALKRADIATHTITAASGETSLMDSSLFPAAAPANDRAQRSLRSLLRRGRPARTTRRTNGALQLAECAASSGWRESSVTSLVVLNCG